MKYLVVKQANDRIIYYLYTVKNEYTNAIQDDDFIFGAEIDGDIKSYVTNWAPNNN